MGAYSNLIKILEIFITFLLFFSSLANAVDNAYTCEKLIEKCESFNAYYLDRIAYQQSRGWGVDKNPIADGGGCVLSVPPGEPEGSKTRYIKASFSASFWCALAPLKCTMPKVKVGTKPNGDDKCECPSGTVSMTFGLEKNEVDNIFSANHVDARCSNGEGSTSDNPITDCCMWNEPNNFCGADYNRNSKYGEPYNQVTLPYYTSGHWKGEVAQNMVEGMTEMRTHTDRRYGITSPDYCVPEAPACPTGTTSQSIVGGRATAESQNRNVAGCEGDNCCVMEDSPCTDGYLPNPDKQPTDPDYCYKDGNCPEGTTAHSGFMGNSNLSYYGNFPSPAYPEYQGFCNTSGCCMGCRSGFSKSNDFCVNSTGEEPPKLCAQGTVMGAYIKTTNSSFGSDAYHTAMDCACPLNSVTRSPNAEKGVMLSGGMHIGGDPSATYQDAVCDYSKVAGNDLSQIPDLEDYFDGSKGACAMLPNGGIDKEKCFKMDGAMKDWLANNVDCGEKQGLDCVSPKMQEMMARCKLVDGVVTCSNFSVGGNGAGEGQVQLPDWIVDNSDKFGFPLPSFDGFEDIDGTGTGSSHKTSTSTNSSGSSTTTSTSSKDGKNPVTPFGEKDKPATGSNGNTTGGLDYFNDAWNSPKNKDLRAKIDEISAAFQRQRVFEIKMSGGEPPCADFSKVELPYQWKLENICLLEPPYVYYFDVLRDVNLLLSMLLPAVIMLRQ